MRRPVAVRRLEQVHHLALRIHREPLLGHRRAGDGRSRHPASRDTRTSLYVVTAQPLAQLPLVRLAAHAGVQREPLRLCHPLVARVLDRERSDRAQHQRLAPRLRPHRNAIRHRAAEELAHRIRVLTRRQLEPRTLSSGSCFALPPASLQSSASRRNSPIRSSARPTRAAICCTRSSSSSRSGAFTHLKRRLPSGRGPYTPSRQSLWRLQGRHG